MVIVSTINGPGPFRVDFRDGGLQVHAVSFVTNVGDLRHATSQRVVAAILIRRGVPTRRNDFQRVVWWLFLLREGKFGSQGLVARCLGVDGLVRSVVRVVLDDFRLLDLLPHANDRGRYDRGQWRCVFRVLAFDFSWCCCWGNFLTGMRVFRGLC